MLKKQTCDLVWLVPCFAHAFGKKLSYPLHRFAMAKLLESKSVKISDYEIQKQGISISFETLQDFSKLYPQDAFSWIIGSDQIEDFPKWDYWQEIITRYGLIIVQRDGKENPEDTTKKALALETFENIRFVSSEDIPDISSTEIRERVKNNQSIHALVPQKIEEYIVKHSLYK